MTKDWAVCSLADICEIQSTLVDPRESHYLDLPHVGAGNIEPGTGRLQAIQSAREEELISGKFLFDDSVVLYSKIRPYLMKVARPDFSGLCSADIYPLVPKPGRAEKDFLFYLLLTDSFTEYAIRGSARAGMPKVNRDHLFGYKTRTPPIEEQRRIVAILDDAFAGIATAKANAEKNLQSARDLVGTGYQTIAGSFDQSRWGMAPVADLAAASKGSMRTGPFGSQLLHSEFVDDGIAVLGIDNAVANEFRWDKRRYITEEKFRDLARYRVHPGDVLITIMGTCGRCAVVPDDIPLAINTKHLCCITLDRKKCLPDYLHLYFLHDPLARAYLAAQAKGSIMAGLNMGIISALPVRLPPLDQQATIVERFNSLQAECDRLADVQTRKLAALDELKQSLLHQAFTGGLS